MISISKEDILRLAQIIREETGNQVQEKNYSMIESRMRSHLIKLKMPSMTDYWRHFSEQESEERELLKSLMTTHYTFFFREYVHFEVLEKWLESNESRLKSRFAQQREPLRVWAAACSRGQEVYSLAMFLDKTFTQKTGIPFQIIGSDIDPESVAFSRNGVYPLKEVNTIPHEFVSGYWKKGSGAVKDFAAVQPHLKEQVQFEVINLLEVDAWKESKSFDVIFCRNVFIYFSEENVRKIAQSLARRLNPAGLLVSGVSEPLRFEGWNLETLGPSCYSKGAANPMPTAAPTTTTSSPAARPATNVIPMTKASPKYSVLCVDDSPVIQRLIKQIFSMDKTCGRIDVANNGREAREKLDAHKYDLITLDIHMPEVSGIEFMERLYKKDSDPPVIMVSSVNRSDLDLATRSLNLGAFDYVEKPAMNNIAKSAGELRTKAHMAMRSARQNTSTASNATKDVGNFDKSIGQKIVVPDASLCMRVVLAGESSLAQLESIVKGQKNEYRSPGLVIVWSDGGSLTNLESQLLSWTEDKVVSLKEFSSLIKPNHIYTLESGHLASLVKNNKARSVSLQILDIKGLGLQAFPRTQNVQVLLDEGLGISREKFESLSQLSLSDLTPATSFPSLSLEFFAELRKAAA